MITIFERTRRYLSLRPALTETFQRALPKKIQDISLFMSGAHGDLYAVFDYAIDTLHEDKLRGDDARWSEQGDADEEQALNNSNSDDEDDDASAITDDTSPQTVVSSTTHTIGHRAHRHSASVPIPRDRAPPERTSVGGRSFPRSRTLPVTSPVPAAALHAMDVNHPRELTSAGILASSPEKRFDPTRPPRPRSLMVERIKETRRASYPPIDPGHGTSVSPQSILERGREGGEVKRFEPLPGAEELLGGKDRSKESLPVDVGAPPWAESLINTLARLEARQERLEEMLLPSEGD